VLGGFVEHAGCLTDFRGGWREFTRRYLRSVEHIVGKQAIIGSSDISDTASVPTSFIHELESLRAKVEELSDRVSQLGGV
jgi:diaphanous 1